MPARSSSLLKTFKDNFLHVLIFLKHFFDTFNFFIRNFYVFFLFKWEDAAEAFVSHFERSVFGNDLEAVSSIAFSYFNFANCFIVFKLQNSIENTWIKNFIFFRFPVFKSYAGNIFKFLQIEQCTKNIVEINSFAGN